jgi:hypothetical protein
MVEEEFRPRMQQKLQERLDVRAELARTSSIVRTAADSYWFARVLAGLS